MRASRFIATLSAATFVVGVVLCGAARASAEHGRKDKDDDDRGSDKARVHRGLEIAPVPLKLTRRNRDEVGLGSYLVNVLGGCNDCHTTPTYAAGGDPFLGEPKVVNGAAYLAGGAVFVPAQPPDVPAVVARNLTPDKSGRPAGGASFREFKAIMRTGVDPDEAHPQYGPLLQVMPWPAFQDLTDDDLRAIYDYLAAVPCVEGEPGLPNPRPIGTRCH